jgi:hypothetical protein
MFKKRPLSQNIEWTEDYVCANDLCSNFIVDNVIISYPTTTTTTTAFPFTSLITLSDTISQTALANGYYYRTEIDFMFNPLIPPGYEVTLDLNSTIELSGLTGGENITDSHSVVITIVKNGVNNSTTYLVDGTTIVNNIVKLVNGDSLTVILENTATSTSIVTLSRITMIPTVTGVTPNSGDFTIVPPQIISSKKSDGTS